MYNSPIPSTAFLARVHYPLDPRDYHNPTGEVWVENVDDVCPKLREFQEVSYPRWDTDWRFLQACEFGNLEIVKEFIEGGYKIVETYKGCRLLVDCIWSLDVLAYVLDHGASAFINNVPNYQPYPHAFEPADNICALTRVIMRRPPPYRDVRPAQWKLKAVTLLLDHGAAVVNPESRIQPLDAAWGLMPHAGDDCESDLICRLLARHHIYLHLRAIGRQRGEDPTTVASSILSASLVGALNISEPTPQETEVPEKEQARRRRKLARRVGHGRLAREEPRIHWKVQEE